MTPVVASPRERKFAYIAWIIVCIVWGTTYLGIRVALETVPVALLAGLRWGIGGLMLTAMPAVLRRASARRLARGARWPSPAF